MKKTHKEKVKMAKRMRSKREVEADVPIFQSSAWNQRRDAIRRRVLKLPPEVFVWEEVKPVKKSLFTKIKEWIWGTR